MKHAICLTALTMLLALAPTAYTGELGDTLEETGWDLLLGTWVDEATGGQTHRWEIVWTHPGMVITWTATEPGKNGTSLLGHSKNQDTFFSASADNQGGSSLGEWAFTEEQAVLGALFVRGDGEEGAVRIILEREDEDTLTVSIDGTDYTLTMVRAGD